MTWLDIFKKYDPNVTEDEAIYLLWNETCFPFDNEIAIKQIEQYYNQQSKSDKTK